jgi:phage baseplate assembly protein gpV
MSDDLEGLIFKCIERVLAGRHTKRYAMATSWDPKTHMVKVMLQPEGVESGWLPVHTMSAGDGYGHMTGIVTGDGTKTGEQLEITHQEGEFEAGAVTARVHSKQQPPPSLESGEQLFLAYFKQFIKFDKNGQVIIQDASGKASMTFDGKGNITLKAEQLTHDVSQTHAINGNQVDING